MRPRPPSGVIRSHACVWRLCVRSAVASFVWHALCAAQSAGASSPAITLAGLRRRASQLAAAGYYVDERKGACGLVRRIGSGRAVPLEVAMHRGQGDSDSLDQLHELCPIDRSAASDRASRPADCIPSNESRFATMLAAADHHSQPVVVAEPLRPVVTVSSSPLGLSPFVAAATSDGAVVAWEVAMCARPRHVLTLSVRDPATFLGSQVTDAACESGDDSDDSVGDADGEAVAMAASVLHGLDVTSARVLGVAVLPCEVAVTEDSLRDAASVLKRAEAIASAELPVSGGVKARPAVKPPVLTPDEYAVLEVMQQPYKRIIDTNDSSAWCSWCTPFLEVNVTGGQYAGATVS